MAKKRVDPLKAKAAKQRKIAIGLSVMFVLVLAYQGPKTLKMLKPPAPPAAVTDGSDPTALPAGVEAAPGVPAPTTGSSAGAPSTPTAAAGADPSEAGSESAVLANTDVPVAAGEGQLVSVEIFPSKDPFQQQVKDTTAGTPATNQDAPDPTGSGSDPVVGPAPASPGDDPSVPGSAENPPVSGGIGGSGSSGSSGSGNPSAPANPSSGPATSTTISVNGVVYPVTVGGTFPTDQPTFMLVSEAKNGKSVQIGVSGGTLAGGAATVKLTVGKPLTLENKATGTRYRLELVTVVGFKPSTSKG